MKLRELAERLHLEFLGDGEISIDSPASLVCAKKNNLSLYYHRRSRKQLESTAAGAVIIVKKDYPENANYAALLSENPSEDFRRAIEILVPVKKPERYISNRSWIDAKATLSKEITVEPFAVIGKAKIGSGSIIKANVVIGDDVEIGSDCIIYPNVVVYDGAKIGNRVIIHACAVIGSDGFGYSRTTDGVFHKIPQIGGVIIEDDVEIGANSAIDRAALDWTIISQGTKIDNLVQIGHNCIVGRNCAMAGQVGLAGSCSLGDRVLLGGQVGLAGHLKLGDDTIVFAQSGVDKSFDPKSEILGSPAKPIKIKLKELSALAKLPELLRKLRKKQII
jgi:UDP-3-O-[3-hydroxymyristoyl] glucosamine N-acyltransferase